mgnify:CR=1 FL=1
MNSWGCYLTFMTDSVVFGWTNPEEWHTTSGQLRLIFFLVAYVWWYFLLFAFPCYVLYLVPAILDTLGLHLRILVMGKLVCMLKWRESCRKLHLKSAEMFSVFAVGLSFVCSYVPVVVFLAFLWNLEDCLRACLRGFGLGSIAPNFGFCLSFTRHACE